MSEFAPPPRHVAAVRARPANSTSTASSSHAVDTKDGATKETWKAWSKRKGSIWGTQAVVKGIAVSDNLGGKVNTWSQAIGSEAFWPVTGDMTSEMDKAARILRAFTVVGVERTVTEKTVTGIKKQRQVLRKIPTEFFRQAKGVAIFTSMRSGMAPFAGAGGAGVVVAKLDDGSWSAPSSFSPNNLSAGLMFGVDIYDAVIIIRTQKALESFYNHKGTVGAEFGMTAGPYGAGAALEAGIERSAVLSYIRSRGLYAGVEVVGQIFITRTEENEMMYYWPGIRPVDILTGKVKVPREAASLQAALIDAETGDAQRQNPNEDDGIVDIGDVQLQDGEVLRLPPTPSQLAREDEEEAKFGRAGEEEAYRPPPPPKRYSEVRKDETRVVQAKIGDVKVDRVEEEEGEKEGKLGEEVKEEEVEVEGSEEETDKKQSGN